LCGKINGIKDLEGICKTGSHIKAFKNKDLRIAVKVMGEIASTVT
jgi:hypothetical protein